MKQLKASFYLNIGLKIFENFSKKEKKLKDLQAFIAQFIILRLIDVFYWFFSIFMIIIKPINREFLKFKHF